VARPIVRVEGAAELSRDFRAAGGSVRELSGAYRAIARQLAGPAQAAAPNRSGKLARSVRGRGRRTAAILTAGSARVPYAGPTHWGVPRTRTYPAHNGTGKRTTGTLGARPANPWLYRTAAGRRDEIAQALEDNVGAVLRRYGLDGRL
jgi:hypothetical protein